MASKRRRAEPAPPPPPQPPVPLLERCARWVGERAPNDPQTAEALRETITDGEAKLKLFSHVMAEAKAREAGYLAGIQQQIMQRLFHPTVIGALDAEELMQLMATVHKMQHDGLDYIGEVVKKLPLGIGAETVVERSSGTGPSTGSVIEQAAKMDPGHRDRLRLAVERLLAAANGNPER